MEQDHGGQRRRRLHCLMIVSGASELRQRKCRGKGKISRPLSDETSKRGHLG